MKILSLHNSLEASVVLYLNGKIASAVSEERFNRKKNYHGFPTLSLNYTLKKFDLKYTDFDYILYGIINSIEPNIEIKKKFETKLKKVKKKYYKRFIQRIETEKQWNKSHIKEIIKFAKKNKFYEKLILLDHHECHAASAYFCSPFNDAQIFTFDGKGGFRSSSHYIGRNKFFQRKGFLTTFDSMGYFYGNITRALGFRSERHEGKVTGLAAFGKKTSLINYFESFIKQNNKAYEITFGKNYVPWFCEKKDLPYFFKKLTKFNREDIAFAAQYILEKTIIHYIKKNTPKNKKINICLAGGVFANVKLNQKIRELKNVKNVYVQPAMGDTGISLGAIYAFLSKKRKILPKFLESVDLGSHYKLSDIKKYLNQKKYKFKKIKNIGKLLIDEFKKGNPIGYFSGKMEFGPRALCNRSILYHGKDVSINDWLNKKLKRTEFMPFAPVTIEDYAKKCFINYKNNDRAGDFMTMTYNCKKDFINKCPASVHVDKTARPQIIRKNVNPKFYNILKNYLIKTNELAIINTSFNKHEEPIVESVYDALSALNDKTINTLIFENYLIKRK